MLPNDAWVVRGGRNLPEDVERGFGVHPSGAAGISVESAPGLTPAALSEGIPHNRVGITTVGMIREAGGDVIRTSGRSPNHATLVGLTPEQISKLLTPISPNPSRAED